ncbi:MAG TPA: serine protein kinase RIO [Candidatus Nanoarchaeia archaeon]|nr:serine protein kinase RIO [Candidatus Nanoarchaeia archaeon]
MVTLTYQERFKTARGVFDAFTNRNLFLLQSKGMFDELVSPLFVGKESNVFLAKRGSQKIIVKIYRVQNCDFKRMYDYIRKDPRYIYLKNQRREIIFAWTQREYKNLLTAEENKVRAPKPLGWKFNILIEEFIGKDEPAPQLKDALPENPAEFFDLLIMEVRKLYKADLIHGDLSPFNILNFNGKPVLIDFSQATVVRTPNSEELLERDVRNLVHFFKKLGLKIEEEKVYKKITG